MTLLEVGSGIGLFGILRVGVCGGEESFSASGMASAPKVVSAPASIDLLRFAFVELSETLCRFLGEDSPLSKGLGRVDGSDEAARSREGSLDSRSIW